MFKLKIYSLLTVLALGSFHRSQAQVQVGLTLPHRLFVAYEPIMVTVSVTNLAGRDITLHDLDAQKWFGFEIQTPDERLIPPRDPDYKLQPLEIPAGQTVKRTVNLTSLFPITEYGLYHVKAAIYFADMQRYFSSQLENVEVTEGKQIWQQTVGAQGGSGYRTMSLLLHRLSDHTVLYVRVEDKEAGIMYCTTRLGKILTGVDPDVQLDSANNLHVLQMCGPRTYIYSQIEANGESITQGTYNQVTTKPYLKKTAEGTVAVRGGQEATAVAQEAGESAPQAPKLSDRPAGLPAH